MTIKSRWSTHDGTSMLTCWMARRSPSHFQWRLNDGVLCCCVVCCTPETYDDMQQYTSGYLTAERLTGMIHKHIIMYTSDHIHNPIHLCYYVYREDSVYWVTFGVVVFSSGVMSTIVCVYISILYTTESRMKYQHTKQIKHIRGKWSAWSIWCQIFHFWSNAYQSITPSRYT